MKTLLKQPLIHFLIVGGLFFLVFRVLNGPDSGDVRSIYVDRESLLTFMQFRSKAFNKDAVNTKLDTMPADEKRQIIDAYVREEALYREAKALGLDSGDYIIKRRVIQKLEFITQGFSDAIVSLSDEQISAYFTANKQDYYIEPSVTFTHVFFNGEIHGRDKAQSLAKQKQTQLNQQGVAFSEGISHGDRFPFHVNYVERTPDFVASHFGKTMSASIFSINNIDETWMGPIESTYGFHVVMLSKSVAGRYPELAEVKGRVYEDALRIERKTAQEKAYQAIVDTYNISIADDVTSTLTAGEVQ